MLLMMLRESRILTLLGYINKKMSEKDKVEENGELKSWFNPYAIIVPAKSKVNLGPGDLRDQMIQTRDLKLLRGHYNKCYK